MMDIQKLKRLAIDLKGWSNLNQFWEDYTMTKHPTIGVVGSISEDGDKSGLVTINCWEYDQEADSIKLAEFYATLNPKSVLELIERIEALEAHINELSGERSESA